MKITFQKQDKDALLRALINAQYNYQIHESDDSELLNIYIMDSRHRELTVTEAFWLGSIFRCEIQADLREQFKPGNFSTKTITIGIDDLDEFNEENNKAIDRYIETRDE